MRISEAPKSTAAEQGSAPLIRLRHVSKVYRRGEMLVPVLEGVRSRHSSWVVRSSDGPFRLGQVDPAQSHFGPRPAHGWRGGSGGNRFVDPVRSGAFRLALRACRIHFQLYNLLPVLTAAENVELPLLLTPLSRLERRRHVELALEIVGLSDRAGHRPSQLSGGEQQRVSIARAIVTDPTLVIADEPTGDLDRKAADQVLDLLQELHLGLEKTIVMVTHDPQAARRAERIRQMEKGALA